MVEQPVAIVNGKRIACPSTLVEFDGNIGSTKRGTRWRRDSLGWTRIVDYLSASSLKKWNERPDEWYVDYVVGLRKPFAQTWLMAIGSLFDVMVRISLANELGIDFDGDWESIEYRGPEDYRAGACAAFQAYWVSGCYRDLLKLCRQADHVILDHDETATISGVPVRGKSDVWIKFGDTVVCPDFKVNGWNSSASPASGYLGYKGDLIFDHPVLGPLGGQCGNKDWRHQMVTYSLMAGSDKAYCFIDQVTFRNKRARVTQIREAVDPSYVEEVKSSYVDMWKHVQAEHYFKNLSLSDSQERCVQLRKTYNTDDRDLMRMLG